MTPPLTLLLSQHAHSHLCKVLRSQIIGKNRCGLSYSSGFGSEVDEGRKEGRKGRMTGVKTGAMLSATIENCSDFLSLRSLMNLGPQKTGL